MLFVWGSCFQWASPKEICTYAIIYVDGSLSKANPEMLLDACFHVDE